MIKNHKLTLIITSIITLLPMIFGLCVWNLLPDTIPYHFDINGNVDSWVSKPVAVFVMPAALTAFEWLCAGLATIIDRKKGTIGNKKVESIVLWIIPCISILLNFIVYATALGLELSIGIILSVFLGLLFIVIGNFLPKCPQSHTMGLKLPWTLKAPNNWTSTHRFAGFVWVICGIIMLGLSWLGNFWIVLSIFIISVIIPTLYSFIYSKKHPPEEKSQTKEIIEEKIEEK